MKRFALLALSAATLLATACKKDSENTPAPQPKTTEQLLSANVWRMTAITANPGLQTSTGAIVTDIYPFVPNCTKDDTQQFVASGQFKMDEGASKCDTNDPQTTTGTWTSAKSGNDTNVNVTVSGGTLHLKVLEVSDTQLKVVTNDDVFGIGTGTSVAYTLTYTKQ
ncbi:lipocalin family protein [Hymenobacter properus]|uniref:Lipocalin family protein n=1 Tax=Hymenobacter properus TaxID=2791026 RepID=A0A931FID1_9BACT|nr:lipocalin family protein [Hymenobacter properus]MBF9141927.1 lipocalin family protein [Hymenobacter properus]MBR7720735.1 lipocalin family protein [Microvirga sp. SRT04]